MAEKNILLAQAHSGLIPTEISQQIVSKALTESAVLKLCNVVSMQAPKVKVPVLADVTGAAAFVGELQEIPIINPKVVDVSLEAKRVSFIIPCTKDFGDLTVLDLLTSYQDVITSTFRNLLDTAVLVGAKEVGAAEEKVFTTILDKAKLQPIQKGKNGEKPVNLLDDISDCMSLVTAKGFPVTGILANLGVENTLRKMKDTTDNFLFANTNNLFGKEVTYTNKFPETAATCVVGDWSRCLVGIFKDLSYDYFDSGTVKISELEEINLIQNYAAALRITAYVASNITYADAFAAVVPGV